jgi:hypothetical protein
MLGTHDVWAFLLASFVLSDCLYIALGLNPLRSRPQHA